MVRKAEEYKWSSYNIYTGRCKDIQKLIDTGKILGIISNNSAKAVKAYAEYVIEDEIMQVMDIEEDTVATSKENSYFISSIDQALEKIRLIAEEKRLPPAEVIQDRAIRNEVMANTKKLFAFIETDWRDFWWA